MDFTKQITAAIGTVAIVVISGLGFQVHYLKGELKNVRSELLKCEVDLSTEKDNVATLLGGIANSNDETEEKKKDAEKKNDDASDAADKTFEDTQGLKHVPTKDVEELNKWLSDLLR